MQKTLAEPIVRLQKTMQTIAESGQYDLRVGDHITVDSNIETSQMANAFDKMLHQIEAHDRLIRDANENLESKIAERTRELLEAQKALVHSAKMSALGELSAGIAHEINNPLAIITGRCAIALRRLDQVSAAQNTSDFQKLHSEIVTDLNKINATALRINKTIRGLRSFARDGQYDPFESQSCNSLIQDAVELCGEKIRSHNIQLRVSELPEDVKIECRGTQITQVLVNLANNARDAIENTLNPWISIEAIVDDSTVRFQVTDSGLGLSPQVIDKLMTPFFTTKSVGKGTGLGLSISRGIAESHRGRLFVDTSPECKNTRFVLEIPLRQPIESAAA
jgi:C4-dicarboxylate-specific signal transduction histidine kinase